MRIRTHLYVIAALALVCAVVLALLGLSAGRPFAKNMGIWFLLVFAIYAGVVAEMERRRRR